MSYKIGDVSKLLDMSPEAIRFYESENIIKPSRTEESRYRVYETWDIFYLLESLKFRSYDFSIKDIAKILYAEDLDFFLNKLDKKKSRIQEEIQFKSLLSERIDLIKGKLETVDLNVGNFWFEKAPAHRFLIYVKSSGDHYGEIDCSNPLFTKWLKYIPFVEFGLHIPLESWMHQDGTSPIIWSLLLEERYLEHLRIPFDDTTLPLPSHLTLCTVINAGSKGELDYSLLYPAMKFIREKGWAVNGDIYGKILLRTHINDKYCRYFEIKIPVERA